MLLGLGTDILRIDRIRPCLDSSPFMHRTFTQTEMNAGDGRSDIGAYYAKIFAAKEAVFKCFGIGPNQLGTWLNIEIGDSDEAQPEVRFSGIMAEVAKTRHIERVMLSLSSDTDYAVAFAAAVREVRNGN